MDDEPGDLDELTPFHMRGIIQDMGWSIGVKFDAWGVEVEVPTKKIWINLRRVDDRITYIGLLHSIINGGYANSRRTR